MKIKHLNKTALILFLFLICCSKEKEQNKPKDISIEKYKKEILMNGNIDAYKQLTLYYLNSPFRNETLPYSIVMADKYNNGDACHEIFVQITGLKQVPGTQHYDLSIFNKLNKGEKEYVLFYLKKGAKLKDIGCIVALRDLGISNKD